MVSGVVYSKSVSFTWNSKFCKMRFVTAHQFSTSAKPLGKLTSTFSCGTYCYKKIPYNFSRSRSKWDGWNIIRTVRLKNGNWHLRTWWALVYQILSCHLKVYTITHSYNIWYINNRLCKVDDWLRKWMNTILSDIY